MLVSRVGVDTEPVKGAYLFWCSGCWMRGLRQPKKQARRGPINLAYISTLLRISKHLDRENRVTYVTAVDTAPAKKVSRTI